MVQMVWVKITSSFKGDGPCEDFELKELLDNDPENEILLESACEPVQESYGECSGFYGVTAKVVEAKDVPTEFRETEMKQLVNRLQYYRNELAKEAEITAAYTKACIV